MRSSVALPGLVLIGLGAWLLWVGAHHEPWVDEAQAWLLARDCSLSELLGVRLRYEGSPGLWHVILWGLVRAGMPYGALFLISTGCALAGAAIVLFRAPFPLPLRVLVVSSYFFAYQYAVVARSYALDLVLVPALAATYARRLERPLAYGALVALLANANAHSFVLAAVLGLELAWSAHRSGRWRGAGPGVAIALAAGALAVFVARPAPDVSFLANGTRADPFVAGVTFVQHALLERLAPWVDDETALGGAPAALIVSLLAVMPTFVLARRAGVLPLAAGVVSALVVFSALLYANAWHAGILTLAWLFVLWISWPKVSEWPELGRIVLVSTGALLALSTIETGLSGMRDVRTSYDGAPAAARAIAELRRAHPDAVIAGAGFKAMAIQPYADGNVFANYANGAPSPSYVSWASDAPWRPGATLEVARAALASHPDALLISTFPETPDELAGFEHEARAAGMRVRARFAGTLIWRGHPDQDDGLVLFERAR